MAIPNPFSASAPGAAAKRRALIKTAGAGATAQIKPLTKSVELQRQALAPSITAAGDYLQQQQGGYDDYSSLLRSAYGVDDSAAASAAYGRSLNPAREQTNQSILRLTPQGVGSGRAMTDLANYEFGNYYDKWLPGIVGQQKQFDPYQAIALQGTLGENLANIEGTYGTNVSGIQGNKFAQIGQARGNYFDTIAGARQNAAGNVLQAGIAGINALGNVAGMAINPASAATKLPQYAASTQARGIGNAGGSGTSPFGWFTGA